MVTKTTPTKTTPMCLRPRERHVCRAIAQGATRGGGLIAALALGVWLLSSSRALALDPNRALTQYVHRIWQTQQGLPQGAIFAVRQADDGYLWLGTQTGLFRFDGVQFTAVRDADDILPRNIWVRDLREDQDHNQWVATDGAGLIRWRDGIATQFTQSGGLPSMSLHRLLVGQPGELWIGTDAGLARLAEGTFVVYSLEQGLATSKVFALARAKDGAIWAGGENDRLSVWNGSEFTPRPLTSLPPGASVQDLHGSSDGTMWVATTHGLVRIEGDRERKFTTADGLPDDWILCLEEGRDGTLWVGTKDGFSRIVNGQVQSFRKRDGLSQSAVYALCEDREGSLWVGTKHGLDQFLDRRTMPITTSEGLPTNDVGPVFQDSQGNTWVGTLGAGLALGAGSALAGFAQFDGRRFTVIANPGGLASDTVLALAGGDDGQLWVGTDKGLCLLRDRQVKQTFTTQQGLPSSEVRCLLRDRSGTIWAGTSAGIAALRDGPKTPGHFVEPAGDAGPLRAPVLALTEYRGELLLATEGHGLYRYTHGRLEPFTRAEIPLRDVATFYKDADGALWLGTRGGGLCLLSDEGTHAFSVKDGLYDDEIYGIAADDQGRLWMACSTGIFSVSKSDLRQFAAGSITRLTSTPFSPTDALRTIEGKAGVQPAAWKTNDGRLWFSTNRGLIVVDPSRLDRSLPPPPVLVEEMTINGERVNSRHVSTLPPGQTNVTFNYTAISFRAGNRLVFRYQLEGFDHDWVDAGTRREAFYTNLPPGSYRFRVAAGNLDGAWSELPAPIAFVLQPHFYQRWWFIPLCVVSVAACGWVAYRLRMRRLKHQMRAVLAERGRIARELHDTLMQGFSGVTMEMQALLARLPTSENRDTLEEIILDAGTCLRDARRSIAGLRSTAGQESGLAAAIAQAARQLTEASDVRLALSLRSSPRHLPAEVEYNLLRIAQEAIANAAKHSGARTIEVALDSTPDQVRLMVKDDGTGLARRADDPAPTGHYGLLGMRERAGQIGAEFRLESVAGRGTAVYVAVPTTQPAATQPVAAKPVVAPAVVAAPAARSQDPAEG